MVFLEMVLPIIINILLIILLTALIVVVIKLIITVERINNLVEDAKEKLSVFNNVITAYKLTTNKIGSATSTILDYGINILSKLFGFKKGEDDDYV